MPSYCQLFCQKFIVNKSVDSKSACDACVDSESVGGVSGASGANINVLCQKIKHLTISK